MKALVSLVAAVARNGVIGRDNQIPWRLPSDLKRFKALTLGHPIVMGRRTFESIGRALPGRENIIVSGAGTKLHAVRTAASLDDALTLAAGLAGANGEIFVIGGAQVYREAIADADRLYITEVDAEPEGDAFFPSIDPDKWTLIRREPATQPPGDSAASAFTVYQRAKAPD